MPSPKTPATKVAGVEMAEPSASDPRVPVAPLATVEPGLDLALAVRVEAVDREAPGRVVDRCREDGPRPASPARDLLLEDGEQAAGAAAQGVHPGRQGAALLADRDDRRAPQLGDRA